MLRLEPTARYVGIVATLRSWKGHLYLVDAFARLTAADATVRLLVIGEGPMRPAIEQKVAELKLAAKVTLAGRQDAVEPWFQAMDVFCLPSYATRASRRQWCRPCSADARGNHAGGRHCRGRNGPGDCAAGYAKGSGRARGGDRRLLDDPALAERMGRAARAVAERRFSRDAMIARMEAVFQGVVDGCRASRAMS